jgi:hypothetical protein
MDMARERTLFTAALLWRELLPGVRQKSIWQAEAPAKPGCAWQISLVEYDKGATVPRHRHVGGDELVYVLEGELSDDFGTITKGNAGYRPDGCVHDLHSRNGGTTISFLLGRSEFVGAQAAGSASQLIDVDACSWQKPTDENRAIKMIWSALEAKRSLSLQRFSTVHGKINVVAQEYLAYVLCGAISLADGTILNAGDVGIWTGPVTDPFSVAGYTLALVHCWE